jgi:hypothetical protein
MFISRRFLVGLGVAGVAVTALFKVCSQQLSQRERLQLKTALNRWEDEGGNPKPAAPLPTDEK